MSKIRDKSFEITPTHRPIRSEIQREGGGHDLCEVLEFHINLNEKFSRHCSAFLSISHLLLTYTKVKGKLFSTSHNCLYFLCHNNTQTILTSLVSKHCGLEAFAT